MEGQRLSFRGPRQGPGATLKTEELLVVLASVIVEAFGGVLAVAHRGGWVEVSKAKLVEEAHVPVNIVLGLHVASLVGIDGLACGVGSSSGHGGHECENENSHSLWRKLCAAWLFQARICPYVCWCVREVASVGAGRRTEEGRVGLVCMCAYLYACMRACVHACLHVYAMHARGAWLCSTLSRSALSHTTTTIPPIVDLKFSLRLVEVL